MKTVAVVMAGLAVWVLLDPPEGLADGRTLVAGVVTVGVLVWANRRMEGAERGTD